MTTTQGTSQRFQRLDKERHVHYSDVLFDSNVVRAGDPVAENRLLALSELLVAKPEYGHIWFSLISLYELLAASTADKRIELLKGFRNLYSRFGNRIRFIGGTHLESVVSEWSEHKTFLFAPANIIDNDIIASIAAGDLVGMLKELRDKWEEEKTRLRSNYDARAKELREFYAVNSWFREDFAQNITLYGTLNALEQCDDEAKKLIIDHAKQPPEALRMAKENHTQYPSTWTYALLVRLAQYAATLTGVERNSKFARYGSLLKPHRNDFIDACIAASGGHCGMLITEDAGLLAKINALHDTQPPLIRLQAFTVYDALIAWNPPDGGVRDRSKPIP
jgi:hypothetical protein